MARTSNKQMYNAEIKEEFLKGYPDNTATTYRYAFYRSYPTEDTLNRDLYTFTTDEIEATLRDADHTTISSLRLTFNVFKEYLRWAAENGYSMSNILIARTISDAELKTYLDKSKKLHFSEEELLEMENGNEETGYNGLVNYQDKVILRCAFEGVFGFGGSELLNLKKETLNNIKDNWIKVHDDKYGDRELKVSDRCIDFMWKAYSEEIYYNKNGESKGRWETSKMVNSDYVLKAVAKRNLNVDRADKHTIYRRLTVISESLDLHFLTAKNIQKSGMIKMAVDLFKRDGELTNKQLAEVAEHFGLRTVNVNGYDVYNYVMLREFINDENIMELYGVDINV